MSGFPEAIDASVEAYMSGFHTLTLGKIVKYDSTKRRATVEPKIRPNINERILTIKPIDNVPVVMPGSSVFNIEYPLEGTGCVIGFSENGIGNYLNGNGATMDADDSTRNSLQDAICIPNISPFSMVPKTKDGIVFDGSILGFMGGLEPLVLGNVLESLLKTYFDTVANAPVDPAAFIVSIKAASVVASLGLASIKSKKVVTQ